MSEKRKRGVEIGKRMSHVGSCRQSLSMSMHSYFLVLLLYFSLSLSNVIGCNPFIRLCDASHDVVQVLRPSSFPDGRPPWSPFQPPHAEFLKNYHFNSVSSTSDSCCWQFYTLFLQYFHKTESLTCVDEQNTGDEKYEKEQLHVSEIISRSIELYLKDIRLQQKKTVAVNFEKIYRGLALILL